MMAVTTRAAALALVASVSVSSALLSVAGVRLTMHGQPQPAVVRQVSGDAIDNDPNFQHMVDALLSNMEQDADDDARVAPDAYGQRGLVNTLRRQHPGPGLGSPSGSEASWTGAFGAAASSQGSDIWRERDTYPSRPSSRAGSDNASVRSFGSIGSSAGRAPSDNGSARSHASHGSVSARYGEAAGSGFHSHSQDSQGSQHTTLTQLSAGALTREQSPEDNTAARHAKGEGFTMDSLSASAARFEASMRLKALANGPRPLDVSNNDDETFGSADDDGTPNSLTSTGGQPGEAKYVDSGSGSAGSSAQVSPMAFSSEDLQQAHAPAFEAMRGGGKGAVTAGRGGRGRGGRGTGLVHAAAAPSVAPQQQYVAPVPAPVPVTHAQQAAAGVAPVNPVVPTYNPHLQQPYAPPPPQRVPNAFVAQHQQYMHMHAPPPIPQGPPPPHMMQRSMPMPPHMPPHFVAGAMPMPMQPRAMPMPSMPVTAHAAAAHPAAAIHRHQQPVQSAAQPRPAQAQAPRGHTVIQGPDFANRIYNAAHVAPEPPQQRTPVQAAVSDQFIAEQARRLQQFEKEREREAARQLAAERQREQDERQRREIAEREERQKREIAEREQMHFDMIRAQEAERRRGGEAQHLEQQRLIQQQLRTETPDQTEAMHRAALVAKLKGGEQEFRARYAAAAAEFGEFTPSPLDFARTLAAEAKHEAQQQVQLEAQRRAEAAKAALPARQMEYNARMRQKKEAAPASATVDLIVTPRSLTGEAISRNFGQGGVQKVRGHWLFWLFQKVLGHTTTHQGLMSRDHVGDLKKYRTALGMGTGMDAKSVRDWESWTRAPTDDGSREHRFWIENADFYSTDGSANGRWIKDKGAWWVTVSHVEKGGANEASLLKMMKETKLHDAQNAKVAEKFAVRVATEKEKREWYAGY